MPHKYNGNLAIDIQKELSRASRGEPLQISAGDWLERFGLDGDEPDGLTLVDRLTEGRNIFGVAKIVLKDVKPTFMGMLGLIDKLSANKTNDQEEQLAENLTQIAVKQITREGDICPGANSLAVTTFMVRPDFFPLTMQDEMMSRTRKFIDELNVETSLRGFGKER